MNIRELVLGVMREEEEEEITDADNVTDYMFSITPSTQREILNAVFASEKLENLDGLVDAVVNMKINNIKYQLNAAILSDAQVKFASDPEKITHTSNGITHQELLSSRTIGILHEEFSILPPPMNPRISAIILPPQTINSTEVQEIVTNAASNNTGTNRPPRKIIRTGINGTTQVHSGIGETSTQAPR